MSFTNDRTSRLLSPSSNSATEVPSAAVRLRQAHRAIRAEGLRRLHEAGFSDVTDAHIPIFRHEGPDGRQPTEIAVTAQLSKQAVNNLLGQLERAGYLTRRTHPDDGRARVVQLTARGRRLEATIWKTGRDVDRQWRERIGERDWRIFRRVLDQIAEANPAEDSGGDA